MARRSAAPVYREQGTMPMKEQYGRLRELCRQLYEYAPDELSSQLADALCELEKAMEATLPISKGPSTVGYGVSKARKAVACDTAISIIKEIKSLKAW